jgi:4-alpha-glucanotransferase
MLLLLLLQEWFAGSEHWVLPYAAFCFLRDLFGTAEHWRWGVMAKPSKQLLADITSPQKEWHNSILCCYWLQYQLHRQLRQVCCSGSSAKWCIL